MRTLFTLFLALAVFPCFSIRVKRDRLLTEQVMTPTNWSGPGNMFHSPVWFVHPSFSYFRQGPEQCRVIDHSGSQGGFRGHLIMIPENDMTIIWLTNGEQELTETIRSILYRLKYIQ